MKSSPTTIVAQPIPVRWNMYLYSIFAVYPCLILAIPILSAGAEEGGVTKEFGSFRNSSDEVEKIIRSPHDLQYIGG